MMRTLVFDFDSRTPVLYRAGILRTLLSVFGTVRWNIVTEPDPIDWILTNASDSRPSAEVLANRSPRNIVTDETGSGFWFPSDPDATKSVPFLWTSGVFESFVRIDRILSVSVDIETES